MATTPSATSPEPRAKPSERLLDPAAEWDTLTTALNCFGVIHVAPGRSRRMSAPRTVPDLFERLWRADEPRLQQASILLLLTHPDLAADARAAVDRLSGVSRDRAMRRYVAAAALQRMARTRIAQHLGPRPAIAPAFLAELALPSLDEEFGRDALRALAAEEQTRYGYDAWGTYVTLLELFLAEIRRRGWGKACDSERIGRGSGDS